MLYYATASTATVRDAMSRGLLGQMRQPDVGHVCVPGARWAADNGCFNATNFTVARWGRWLLRHFFFPEVLDLRTIARAFYAVAGQ